MTALPPPKPPIPYALVGAEIGALYALLNAGWAAIIFPVAGFALGKLAGALYR